MIIGDESKHLIEVGEVVENIVFKHGVELVLNRCDDSVLLIHVQAKVLELLVPVHGPQVKQFEVVDDLAHSGLHLRLIQELLVVKTILGQLLSAYIIPRISSSEPIVRDWSQKAAYWVLTSW